MFLSAQKNRFIETVLLSTHNICFGWKIRFFLVTHPYRTYQSIWSALFKLASPVFSRSMTNKPVNFMNILLCLKGQYTYIKRLLVEICKFSCWILFTVQQKMLALVICYFLWPLIWVCTGLMWEVVISSKMILRIKFLKEMGKMWSGCIKKSVATQYEEIAAVVHIDILYSSSS